MALLCGKSGERDHLHAPDLLKVPLTQPAIAGPSLLPSPRKRGEGAITTAAVFDAVTLVRQGCGGGASDRGQTEVVPAGIAATASSPPRLLARHFVRGQGRPPVAWARRTLNLIETPFGTVACGYGLPGS